MKNHQQELQTLGAELLRLQAEYQQKLERYQELLLAEQPFQVGDMVQRYRWGTRLIRLYEVREVRVEAQTLPSGLPQVEIALSSANGRPVHFQRFRPEDLVKLGYHRPFQKGVN